MKHLFVLAAVLILTASVGAAATVNCPDPPSSALPLIANSSLSFTCAGLTFSNFMTVAGTPNLESTTVDLVRAQIDSGQVVLSFNPNLSNQTNNPMDLQFFFQVGGPVIGLELTTGGSGSANIVERACDSPIAVTTCDPGHLLAQTPAVFSNESASIDFPRTANSTFIFKDIAAPAGTSISDFTESFRAAAVGPPGQVPEPLSLALMGSGLLALGLWRRKAPKT